MGNDRTEFERRFTTGWRMGVRGHTPPENEIERRGYWAEIDAKGRGPRCDVAPWKAAKAARSMTVATTLKVSRVRAKSVAARMVGELKSLGFDVPVTAHRFTVNRVEGLAFVAEKDVRVEARSVAQQVAAHAGAGSADPAAHVLFGVLVGAVLPALEADETE